MTGSSRGRNGLLDAPQLRRLRLLRGLSERELAKAMGVTGAVVATMERGGNHDELPAATLVALAGALGVTVGELFESAGTPGSAARDDASMLGTLVAGERRLIAITALAEALDWTSDRTIAAVDVLETRLPPVGMRLHRLGNDIALVPASTDPSEALAALGRRSFARRGMSLAQARMLYRVFIGDVSKLEEGNASRVTFGSLVNADLLVHRAGDARGSRPTLSTDALDGLHHVLTSKPRLGPAATRRGGTL